MSPVDREIVRRKLERIADSLRLLEPMKGLSLEAYRGDVYRRKATERLLQEIVEAAVDVNLHLLAAGGGPIPDDLYSSFVALGEAGFLDASLAARLAPSAGLRNRLVHEYDRLDDALILASVREALEMYPASAYLASVERALGVDQFR